MKALLTFFLIFPLFLSAQPDSLFMNFKTLTAKDLSDEILSDDQAMISASRSQKSVGELPLTAYIVTKEEIHENGYNTLVDVLKTVPGIRVSQPGSATEGETFLTRGLIGNQNMKILINDVPIKPTFLLGMPIGSQLPVRQAERIEIIFGPAGAVYGSDASAGVINIILRESERPVFVSADLNFGSENYRGLNLLLGGKFGLGKNIVKFTGFGSFTRFDNRRIFSDTDDLFDFRHYHPDRDSIRFKNLVRNGLLPNYQTVGGSFVPVLREFPHISRLFGVNAAWRNFKFFYENMYRRDHSALGSNPTAISVSNSQNYTAESMSRFFLSWKKSNDRFTFQTLANSLTSNADKFSSSSYVINVFGHALLDEIFRQTAGNQQLTNDLWGTIQGNYLEGSRFKNAVSTEGRLEQLISYHPNEQFELTTGVAGYYNSAVYADYADRPINDINALPDNFVSGEEAYSLGVFSQLYYVSGKMNLLAGLQVFKEFEAEHEIQYAPRIAALFKQNARLNYRLFYGKSFRHGSPYYAFNTYFFDRGELKLIDEESEQFSDLDDTPFHHEPEITNTFEAAVRWKNKKLRSQFEVIGFHTRTENLISFDQINTPLDSGRLFGIGYFNFKDIHTRIYGVQANITSFNLIPRIGLNTKLYVQRIFGEERLPKGGDIDGIRAQPGWTVQLKTDMKLGRVLRLNLFHLYQSKSLSRLLNNRTAFEEDSELYTLSGYYTLDAMLLGQLTDNFRIYLRVNNVFNKKYAGIDATGTPNDLIWNPQSARWITAGISYQL